MKRKADKAENDSPSNLSPLFHVLALSAFLIGWMDTLPVAIGPTYSEVGFLVVSYLGPPG